MNSKDGSIICKGCCCAVRRNGKVPIFSVALAAMRAEILSNLICNVLLRGYSATVEISFSVVVFGWFSDCL